MTVSLWSMFLIAELVEFFLRLQVAHGRVSDAVIASPSSSDEIDVELNTAGLTPSSLGFDPGSCSFTSASAWNSNNNISY